MPRRILLLNGPNLNLLGTREPHIYGATTLSDIETKLQARARALGATLETFQSNHEGALVDRIQQAGGFHTTTTGTTTPASPRVSAVIINPGALTHTSVALRDALAGVALPFVEVHVSNVHAREAFRHHSYLSDKAVAVVAGLGVFGYQAALEFVVAHLEIEGEE